MKSSFRESCNTIKMNTIKKKWLRLCALSLALMSVGCTGSNDMVEPNRDNFNDGEVELRTLSSARGAFEATIEFSARDIG